MKLYLAVVLLAACASHGDELSTSTQAVDLFDCAAPAQRLTCAPPANPNKRYVCHATGSTHNPYNKLSVSVNSSHQPGVAHGCHPPDQAPGASADDLGGAVGLDCECEPRDCNGTCTGAAPGTACEDGDLCTGNGTCNGDTCEPGAPRCVAGTPIDACSAETGVCEPSTGTCGAEPLPAGTTCGSELVCNGGGSCVAIADVVINEVESSGGVPGDWIELVNAGATPADVSGWRVLDNDNTHTAYVLPIGTTIPVGGYLVVDEAQLGFGLGSADSARLFDATSSLVDSYAWTAHAVVTYGRCPDATGALRNVATATKGAANDCSLALRINEIESSGGSPGDWTELFNGGPFAIDLSGFVFKDNDDTHAYVVPQGTSIAAGGYLVLDEAGFGFGLGAADSARIFDGSGTLIDSHSWTSHAVTTYARCPNGTGSFGTATASTKGTANDCSVALRINEVESSGGSPGDWTELFNAGPIALDLSGWTFKDNDDTHAYVLPSGSVIAAGGYLVLDEATFGFGLGAADSARIYDTGSALIDSYAWTAHAATTYARCPNGSGDFATSASSTKGASNSCGGGGPTAAPWPGPNAVTTADAANTFGGNASGLFYDASSSSLWVARNGPGQLFRLEASGAIWAPAQTWTLRYPDGTGSPDAEDVTKAELASSAVYVATERNNDVGGVSRMSILRYDTSATGPDLIATHEWNVTPDLPAAGSNLGLEAITWIPDSFLVANAWFDPSKGHAYNPAEYPNHGTGIFFVGVEATGSLHAYALDHVGGGFARLATFASGDTTSKALAFDRDTGYLWSFCGASCGNQSTVWTITAGTLQRRQQFAGPSSMPNLANEGIAIAPESTCTSSFKAFWWIDDAETGGHALRRDAIPCGAFVP
jgi:hypothetical protein